jgi:phosphoserine phosphatase RsbU/P
MAARLVAVIIGCALAVCASVELGRREALLTRSRAAAEAAQLAILPTVPDRLGDYVFSCLYRSSAEEALVGGDFYKVIASPWGQRFVVGDVEGKGLAAVGMSALVLGCFREWAPRTARLADLVATLDERVHSYEERSAFVTAVVGSLNDDLTLELANCGHVFPVLSRDGVNTVLAPDHTTTPLGFGPTPSLHRIRLRAGDRVLLYTDGLTETRTREGRWLALEEVITDLGTDPVESVLVNVATRITAEGTLRDDLAMLLVEVAPQQQHPPSGMTIAADPPAANPSPAPNPTAEGSVIAG